MMEPREWIRLKVEGQEGSIDGRALAQSATAMTRLLEHAANSVAHRQSDADRAHWVVSRGRDSGSVEFALGAPEEDDVAESAMKLTTHGMRALRESPSAPTGWTRGMLHQVHRLHDVRGLPGVQGLQASGSGLDPTDLVAEMLNVEKVLSRNLRSLGSVTGLVVEWRQARGKDHIRILDEVTKNRVDVLLPSTIGADVAGLIRQRVTASGIVERNLDGVKAKLVARSVMVRKERPHVPIDSVAGLFAGEWSHADPVDLQREHRDAG